MASIADYWRAFKGVGKIKEEIKTMEQKKSGFRTSEFWLSIAGIIGTGLAAFGGFIPAELAVKITLGMTTAYTVARAIVKATATKADDEFLDALAGKLGGLIKPGAVDKQPQDAPKP